MILILTFVVYYLPKCYCHEFGQRETVPIGARKDGRQNECEETRGGGENVDDAAGGGVILQGFLVGEIHEEKLK